MYELAARLKQVRDDGKEARSLKVLISDQGVRTPPARTIRTPHAASRQQLLQL